ncbi:MAG: SHOCT domain-containing protein [Campylobacterales bacterium]|nr:SHOCT domain-containing protein [Campylobacterales bacterium]
MTDDEDFKTEQQNKPFEKNTNLSISDEIRKLKSLKDDGLITNDEFLSQKEKLLNN